MSVYKRGAVWWVRFQHDGAEIRRPARTKVRAEALKYEKELRTELSRVSRGGKPRRTYEAAMNRFLDEYHPTLKPSAARRYFTSAKMMNPFFDGLYLDEINRGRLSDYVSARKKGGTATATIRRDLACLSSLFTCAVDWDWCEINPVKQINKRGIPDSQPRRRYLSVEDEAALIDAAKRSPKAPYLANAIAVAIDTGLRFEEQMSLEWAQVSVPRLEITVWRTKSNSPRIVPMLPRTAQILAQLPRHLTRPESLDYVFRKPDGSRLRRLTRSLATAAKRAGLKDLEWHDFRRTCGSRLLQDYGMEMKRVADWLGHSSIVVTERAYAFLRTGDLHRAVGTKPGTAHTDMQHEEVPETAEKVVPGGGFEPPTRGFSIPRPMRKKTAETKEIRSTQGRNDGNK